MREGPRVDDASKERLLQQFRHYLDGVDALPDIAGDGPAGGEADLFTVFVELAAMRNEVRTESRLVKDALDQFRSAFDTLQSAQGTLEQELKRAHADARERGEALMRPLLLDLLDLRDRLDAALTQTTPPPAKWLNSWWRKPVKADTWREGIGITARRLDRILTERRVRRMNLTGERFDPRLARVVSATADPHAAPGTVVEEVRAGYTWNDELLRVAEVIVSKSDKGDSQA
jgi:molecular chaperone GrpE